MRKNVPSKATPMLRNSIHHTLSNLFDYKTLNNFHNNTLNNSFINIDSWTAPNFSYNVCIFL